jgi:type IV pilus assembly protein PilC
MASYSYTAKDSSGKTIEGNYEAENTKEVSMYLRGKKYIPLRIEKQAAKKSKGAGANMDLDEIFGVSKKNLAIFCRQFATTLRSGITVLDSLKILENQTEQKYFSKVIGEVHEEIQKGSTLSKAMGKYPKVFPPLLVNMLASGEVSGNIDSIMDKMATYYEEQTKINRAVVTAMAYPAIVSVVAVGVVVFLLAFIMPTFTEIFEQQGVALPLPTQILLAISYSLIHFWFVYIIGIILLVVGFFQYKRTDTGRKQVDYIKLKIPIFGKLNMKIAMARFSSTLSLLLTSGVDIIQAVEVTQKVVNNAYLAEKLESVLDGIQTGFGLGYCMKQSGEFPPIVYQMIEVGENSGSLDFVLEKINDFYTEEVNATVAQLTSILEPIIIVFLGGIVLFIIASIILPMFSMYTIIG